MPKRRNRQMEVLNRILNEGLPWPFELEAKTRYEVLHDDHDGTMEGKIAVVFMENGDAVVLTDTKGSEALRFRTAGGGGSSVRVRNALVILALAIKRDNENRRKGS